MSRWDALFADLAAQLEAADSAEMLAEVADRTRREVATLRLVDRLRALPDGAPVRLLTAAGGVDGTLLDVGADWVLVSEGWARQALVPLAALLGVSGVRRHSAAPGSEGAVGARLTLGYALRGIARERAPVTVLLADGSPRTGTIDRVGADFCELAELAPGELRRPTNVTGVLVIPFAALAVVRSG